MGAQEVALDVLDSLGGNPASVPWSGSCTFVADGIQSLGSLTVGVSGKGGSVSATVTCTLGSASTGRSSLGSHSVYFTHTGTCTLTASGSGYGSAAAS